MGDIRYHGYALIRAIKHYIWKGEKTEPRRDPRLGAHSCFGPNSFICHPDSKIGKFCSIAPNVAIGPGAHPKYFLSTHPFQYHNRRKLAQDYELKEFEIYKPVKVGNDVWIGMNVVVIDGITIGDGAIIGANSVVTKDVEPYQIYVGGGGEIMVILAASDFLLKLSPLCLS